jgi:hypothetical protein
VSDKDKQQQIEKEIVKESNDVAVNRDQGRENFSYQPEKSELDDNNPPKEDSES